MWSSLSFSFSLYRGGGGWVSLSSYQSMTSNQCSSFIEDWICFTCSFLSSLSVLSTRRRRRSRSDTEHWRCKGKPTSLLLFVRERARAWDDVSTLHWNTFLTSSQVELVRLLLLMMLLLLLQQQQQQVVNHQHMVFSVCCLFASLISSFSFSFIERERDMIQYNANLSSFQLVTYQ